MELKFKQVYIQKFLLIPNAYKGTYSASQIATAMEEGIKHVFPQAECLSCPVADGGDGTIDIVASASKGSLEEITVPGPLNIPVRAKWFLTEQPEDTAVIELAQASGLTLLDELDALNANTYGTGLIIKEAFYRGLKKIILTVGGSATTDGGTGILQALGAKFFDINNLPVSPCGGNLKKIERIDLNSIDRELLSCQISVACDVNNPLCGPNGAAFVFAPQKGANEKEVQILDEGLFHFGNLLIKTAAPNNLHLMDLPGAGAAGGVPFALSCVFGANIISGFDWVSQLFSLEQKIIETDIVLTGEGAVDEQSVQGKAVGKILELCNRNNKPLWIFPAVRTKNGYEFLKNKATVFPIQKDSSKNVDLKDIAQAVTQACLETKS